MPVLYRKGQHLQQYQAEYIKDHGRQFTIREMAEFLSVSYYVARNMYQKLKIKPWPESCKNVKREKPSIEEYKTVFQQ